MWLYPLWKQSKRLLRFHCFRGSNYASRGHGDTRRVGVDSRGFGLAMAASAELSFNFVGFFAACMCNCIDCIQNVFSKKLLSGRYTSVELQFYTSAAALLVQFPLFLYRAWSTEPNEEQGEFNSTLMYCLLIDGVSYHLQSVFAYKVMSYISPVTVA